MSLKKIYLYTHIKKMSNLFVISINRGLHLCSDSDIKSSFTRFINRRYAKKMGKNPRNIISNEKSTF